MNAAFEEKLNADIAALKAAGTYKTLRHLTTPMAAHAHMEEAGDVVVLSSNNYLGLSDHPEVVAAGIEGLQKYGAGTASVRFICGTFDIHRRLEEKIAAFFGFEAALTYVSCWTANEGLLPTVGTAGNTLISDELNHASIIDGCRLAAAKRLRYKHGDLADLEAKLHEADGTAFVVTDGKYAVRRGSIFSGDDSFHAGQSFRAGSVDAADARVSVRRMQNPSVQHSGNGKIVSIFSLAGNFAWSVGQRN